MLLYLLMVLITPPISLTKNMFEAAAVIAFAIVAVLSWGHKISGAAYNPALGTALNLWQY